MVRNILLMEDFSLFLCSVGLCGCSNECASESFSRAEYPKSTAEDVIRDRINNIIVANRTSQHFLHILDVPAAWVLLCS